MADEKLKGWHYMPDVPLQVSPFFRWPLKPLEMLKWVWDAWFLISEKLIILGIAWISYLWFQPGAGVTQTFALDWILGLWLRNMVLFTVIVGALHLYFYRFTAQGQKLRYDARPLGQGRQFTLGVQVRDNMVWSLGSGVTIWTAFEVLMFWCLSNGWAPMLSWGANPVWFIAIFLLIPVWESFYFYLIHRLLHVPFLYKHVHALHHRNVNVGPWSGLSMHPVEHLIYLGSVLVHLIVGAHPIHILFHLQYICISAATTHTGFEGLWMKDKNRLKLGTFHHQMHHRYFECNYGSLEIPWDKWFGSFHDGTQTSDAKFRARRAGK